MEKPVIILGGGLIGGLLAYRMKMALPEVDFKLYQESSVLGDHELCSFRQSDCEESMGWMKPFINHSWDRHQIKFPRFHKWLMSPYHLIESQHFHDMIFKAIGPDRVKLSDTMDIELALREASFVIDTRNRCHYKKKGFRKFLYLDVELSEDHHLIAPVVFEGCLDKNGSARNFRYFPLGPRRLLVNDFWYSKNNQLHLSEMRLELSASLSQRGWKISRVIREDFGVSEVPISDPIILQEGRVINLASLFHDTTGCAIPLSTRLIDRMVQTSFRFGEIKEVVTKFRQEHEADKKFFRFLNRLLLEENQQIFEAIYQQPAQVLERFHRGKLNYLDRSRIIVGKSRSQLKQFASLVLPYSVLNQVQIPAEKRA